MKNIGTLATTALLIGVVIFGCKKDQVEPNPAAPNPGNPNPTTDLDLNSDLFTNTGVPLQCFTMEARSSLLSPRWPRNHRYHKRHRNT